MSTPNLSDKDKARLDSGDYVVDPVFGVQPKTPDVQRRDRRADLDEASKQEQAKSAEVVAPTPAPTPAPKAPVVPKDNPQL